MRWALIVALVAGCKTPPPPVEPPPKKSRPTKAKSQPQPEPPPAECAADTDCVLMPELGCCGECPPLTPFEAVTRAELDAAIIEEDEHCATEDWDCDAFQCSGMLPGCQAKASCHDGQCVVASNGC